MTTATEPRGTLGSVASLLTATLYQGNPNRNHKHWKMYQLRDIYTPYADAAKMLLHMKGKFTMQWKIEIISFVVKFRS